MDSYQIKALTDTFEGHAQQTESGVEYWLARDLQQLLDMSVFLCYFDKLVVLGVQLLNLLFSRRHKSLAH